MKACPKCNTQLADDAVFCTGCGQKFEATEAQIEKVCKKCGSPLSADTQFCTKCGTPVGTISKISQQKDAIEGSSQKPSSRPPASSQSMPTMAQTPPASMPPIGTSGTSQNLAKNPAVLIGGVFALVAIVAFLFFKSSGSGNIPKTPEDFVSAYNREIKDIAKEKKVNANLIALEDVPSELKDLMQDLMQADETQGAIDGQITMKATSNRMIVFGGAKMKNQSLQLAFQMKHKLDSDAFFGAMEGFVKASGGDVEAVMKGLGILSGQRYNIPADYAKEFVYNNNLSYKVISMGGYRTTFIVQVGNGGNSKPAATTAATNEPQKPQSAQPQKQQNAQAPATNTPSKPAYVDPMQYVTKKNQYDREISKLASDVNAYLGSHANFRNENTMLSRAENISRQIYGAKEALRIANIQNTALKNKLMEVFDALQGRADGLLDGIRASKNGGDHNPGFKRGGDAYDRFEAANEALNRML